MIVEHGPIGAGDGLYHESSPLGVLLQTLHYTFQLIWLRACVSVLLTRTPLGNCHMQAAVVRKPEHSRP